MTATAAVATGATNLWLDSVILIAVTLARITAASPLLPRLASR
jgi:hypothetical protein